MKAKSLVIQTIEGGILLLKVVKYRTAFGREDFPVVEHNIRLDTNEKAVKDALEALGWRKDE